MPDGAGAKCQQTWCSGADATPLQVSDAVASESLGRAFKEFLHTLLRGAASFAMDTEGMADIYGIKWIPLMECECCLYRPSITGTPFPSACVPEEGRMHSAKPVPCGKNEMLLYFKGVCVYVYMCMLCASDACTCICAH